MWSKMEGRGNKAVNECNNVKNNVKKSHMPQEKKYQQFTDIDIVSLVTAWLKPDYIKPDEA